jgi:hypothetical protein
LTKEKKVQYSEGNLSTSNVGTTVHANAKKNKII